MSAYNLTQFRELIRKAKHASDPDIKFALARVASEAKSRLGDSSADAADFFEGLRQSVLQIKGNSNAPLRITCLLDCANYFYVVGDLFRGIMAAQDALKLARQVKDVGAIWKSLSATGIFFADTGSIAQAIEAHVEAAEITRQLGEQAGQVGILSNLGAALLYGGQFAEAISCLRLAESLVDPQSIGLLPYILTNQAACLHRLDRIEEGLEVASRSVQADGAPTTASRTLSLIVREFNYLQLLLEAGQRRIALERVAIIRDHAIRVSSRRGQAIAGLADGLVESYYGDPQRGLDVLEYQKGEVKASTALYHDALIALVKAYEQSGRYAEALACLEEYLLHVRKTRQEFALWHVRTGSRYLRTQPQAERGLEALEQRGAILRARVAEDRVAALQIEMLERLAIAADLREEATGQHGFRVGRLSAEFARELGWSAEDYLALDIAARLHDLGKIGMPDRILLGSQKLKDAERHFMCTHPLVGAEILSASQTTQLKMAEEIALLHHEWWDGNGYPKKLSGK